MSVTRDPVKDSFVEEHLPDPDLWPDLRATLEAPFLYPDRINCAAELLDCWATSSRPLFLSEHGTWTYARFSDMVNRIANLLVQEHGLRIGGRVLLRGPNSPMLAAVWFAVAKAGGVCVTTMPMLRSRELHHVVQKARVDLALCDAICLEDLLETMEIGSQLKNVLAFEGCGGGELGDRAQQYEPAFATADTRATDPALIAFTSGSTGDAKATVHFHRDVLAICDAFPRSTLRARESDVFCGSPPLGFTFGLGGLLLFPMRIGASVAVPTGGRAPVDALLSTIERHRATVCFTSPTAYRAMLTQSDQYDLSSLRTCVAAGEPLSAELFDAWRSQLGISLLDGLGTTEMLHIFISASADQIRPGSIGRAIPGYEARVVDEAGNDRPVGEIGLLAVRGPTGCRYLDDEARQAEYVRDGWNYTGDLCSVDSDGYFWYHSRADDMIVSAGYNISGVEVENALIGHPSIKECAVVGVPDPERGHVVKSYVVLEPEYLDTPGLVEELQAFAKARIAAYKYPRLIEFVEQLPRTATGKVQRHRLRSRSEPRAEQVGPTSAP